MIRRKLTLIEVMIVSAILLVMGIIVYEADRKASKQEVEKIEPTAKLKNTDTDLTYLRNSDYGTTSSPKTFFKLRNGRTININNVNFDDTFKYNFDSDEKIRFEEWIDSWGVLTMENKK